MSVTASVHCFLFTSIVYYLRLLVRRGWKGPVIGPVPDIKKKKIRIIHTLQDFDDFCRDFWVELPRFHDVRHCFIYSTIQLCIDPLYTIYTIPKNSLSWPRGILPLNLELSNLLLRRDIRMNLHAPAVSTCAERYSLDSNSAMLRHTSE